LSVSAMAADSTGWRDERTTTSLTPDEMRPSAVRAGFRLRTFLEFGLEPCPARFDR